MTQHKKLRLLIADDHEVIRCGLKSLLADTEIKVVAEVATAQDTVKYALENDVDAFWPRLTFSPVQSNC